MTELQMTKGVLVVVLIAQVAMVYFDWMRTSSQTESQQAFIEKVHAIEACKR